VVEACGEPRLLQEALPEALVGAEVADQQLQRDVATESGVMGPVDRGGPPRPSKASIR
jgi:hypothetical protein